MTPAATAPPTETDASTTVLTPPVPESEEPKVLDLTDLVPTRQLVKLPTKRKPEGEPFELRLIDDFGIERQQQLMSWGRRYQQLMNKDDDLNEGEVSRLVLIFSSLFDAILKAPDAVKKTMSDATKNKVITAFINGPLLMRQEAQMVVIQRLLDRGHLQQGHLDEVMAEMRLEVSRLISES